MVRRVRMGGHGRERVVAMMTITRMSAGAGYRYLLRSIATHDRVRVRGMELVAYYALSGNPPGRWLGAGLPGLGAGAGQVLLAGTVVAEEAMAQLFGSGHDPVTGGRLGLAYPQFKTAEQRVAERVGRLPEDLSEDERAAAVVEIETQERARPQRSAVAGYDLTFTVPKSVSVLWALGDEDVRLAVEAAHHEALDAVLELIEDRFLHTRIGEGSKIRVPARGAIAAAFDHYDTRAGDPNLHTHLVIANKVQGPDGRWRAVDGQVLFDAAVALSEIYDSTLADILATRLPVTFGYRDRGPRRTPAHEIDGISDKLLAAFSARSQAIGVHLQDLVAVFTDAHGREPNRVEILRLRQQATLATRPDKHVSPLTELRHRWRATAETLTGQPAGAIASAALTSTNSKMASIASIASATGTAGLSDGMRARYADAVVAALSQRRPTWTSTNLLAEAARATRAMRLPDAATRIALVDQVVTAALDLCIALDPPPGSTAAGRYTHRSIGASAEAPEPAFTTWAILAAEARLLTAHTQDKAAPIGDPQRIEAVTAATPLPGRPRLSAEQARAAAAIAGSARRLDLLVGPAGTGKTRALGALRAAWEHTHGNGTVIGLAPSAAAAAELGASLGIGAETLAKWIHQSALDRAGDDPWRLRPGQLVIVDEAAMAPTNHLDQLVGQATAAGAKVVLVGDHHQLGAVETGGAFALLVEEGHAVELEQLHRFAEGWEAEATRRLRRGDPAVLDTYAAHGRLHDGPAEAMIEAAYRAWAAETANGIDALLLAADRDTVTALNRRARVDQIRAGRVDQTREISLHDGTQVGRGDLIITRRNDRRIARPDSGHVRNGDRWRVIAVHAGGALDVIPADRTNRPTAPGALRLPADYVRHHVELGYALTVHRAQGRTADSSHVIADPSMTRPTLYVAMTRGKHANRAYLALDSSHPGEPERTATEQWSEIVGRDPTPAAATAMLRARLVASAPSLAPAAARPAHRPPREPYRMAPAPRHELDR